MEEFDIQFSCYMSWRTLCTINGQPFDDDLGDSDPGFIQTLAQFGDASQPKTWEQAFAFLKAEIFLLEDDPHFLVEDLLRYSNRGWRHLLQPVLERILQRPHGIENLYQGVMELRQCGWMDEPDPEGLALLQEMAIACNPSEQIRQLQQQILNRL